MKLSALMAAAAAHSDSAFVSFHTNTDGDRLVGLQKRMGPGDDEIVREDYLTDGVNVAPLSPVEPGCLERGRAALAKLGS